VVLLVPCLQRLQTCFMWTWLVWCTFARMCKSWRTSQDWSNRECAYPQETKI
jgi:hypothetical protein